MLTPRRSEERARRLFQDAVPATLEGVLAARDARAAAQRELLERYGGVLICLTLNLPGEYKRYPLAERAFHEGFDAITAELESHGIPVLYQSRVLSVAGCEGYASVRQDAEAVKRMMMSVEETHALGRLFDIDVLDRQGRILKGAALGRGERRCFVCGGPVWACARSRAHSAEELALRAAAMLLGFFDLRFADRVCGTAVRALLAEVTITPKPGLVDRANSGAHSDMNIFTFLDSSCALIPYFRELTLTALGLGGGPDTLLSSLRRLGLQAESAMLAATGGVNAHKGLIFSMGVLCAALGYLYGQDKPITDESVFTACADIAGAAPAELSRGSGHAGARPATYGERAYAGHRVTGARGEAAAGFPHVRDVGLPVLRLYLARGCALNEAGAIALLHLIARVDDTNIAGRAGFDGLREVREAAAGILRRTDDPASLLEAARALDALFIKRHVSPGGSADLLALSLMIHWIGQQ